MSLQSNIQLSTQRCWTSYKTSCGLIIILLTLASTTFANERVLTLSQAIEQVLEHHPELSLFRWRHQALEGTLQQAELKPGYELELALEDMAGSGDFSDLQRAEATIALSSIIELGKKRDKRLDLVTSERTQLEFEQQIVVLELLREVTSRYIDLMATQASLTLSEEASSLAKNIHRVAKRRADAGATPEAEVKRTQAAAGQARLKAAAANSQFEYQKIALAALWGDPHAHFSTVENKLFEFGEQLSLSDLFNKLNDSPLIQIYGAYASKKNAELYLAQSQGKVDLEWGLGIKQFEASNDFALTAGVSVPLYLASRGEGKVNSLRAEQEQNLSRKQMALLHYRMQLLQALTQRQQAIVTVNTLREEIIPALTLALSDTQRGYQRGRYTYHEYVAVQHELLEARQDLIRAAASALHQNVLIDQLTTQPIDIARYQMTEDATGSRP